MPSTKSEECTFLAPNGVGLVTVRSDGFVQPVSGITNAQLDLLMDVSGYAYSMAEGDPFKTFKLMGWKDVTADSRDTTTKRQRKRDGKAAKQGSNTRRVSVSKNQAYGG